MRLLICAGMTGGGVYPALAVLQTMDIAKQDVLWIGSENSMEANLLASHEIHFQAIPAAGVHGVGITKLPGNIIRILKGYQRARVIIGNFKPDAVFYTGGYLSFPVSLAARYIPSVAFIPDIEPGSALKYLVPRCDLIAITTEASLPYIPKNKRVEITGYPIRPALKKWNKAKGKKELGLHNRKPVVLVFGGSKGARSINQALEGVLPQLLKEAQVIHITGSENWDACKNLKSSLPDSLRIDYHPYAFLGEQMGAALASADLAVCRAGASTLGELPFFTLPAILVPYPHAWRYQYTNAEYLTSHGGAIILQDQDLQTDLYSAISSLLHDSPRLKKMGACMQKLSHPDAAKRIGELIISATKVKGGKQAWSV
jgi:undecaprenyldiphospho-muramoylpentapeptide beta-N-acetylglucosaminyltransferase